MNNEKAKNFISAVVYVRNSESNIQDFLSVLYFFLSNNFENSEIVCVNDDSNDRSIDIIREFTNKNENISLSIVNMSYFQGLESSMNAGVDFAIGDYIYEFDSIVIDYNKELLLDIYKKAMDGYDIVSATPKKNDKWTSNLFYKLFNTFGHYNYNLRTERFRIISRRTINRVGDYNKARVYRKSLYATCGLKNTFIEYIPIKHISGKVDTANKHYRMELGIDSIILFTRFGYVFAITMTIAMMILMVVMLIYTILFKFLNTPVAGWASTFTFLSIAFFGLFGILTVIIKYLQLILDMQVKRKKYNFNSFEKLN